MYLHVNVMVEFHKNNQMVCCIIVFLICMNKI